MKERMTEIYIYIILFLLSAAFILIGVCVYGGKGNTFLTDNLHFAFAFVIIGALLAIIAAILVCLDK